MEEETVTVCFYCEQEITTLTKGDEFWDFCEGCHMVETDTKEINIEDLA